MQKVKVCLFGLFPVVSPLVTKIIRRSEEKKKGKRGVGVAGGTGCTQDDGQCLPPVEKYAYGNCYILTQS